MATSFMRYLFEYVSLFVFQIKMKNEKRTSNLNFNVQLFLKWKNGLVLFLCLNFSIETKIKTLFLISCFNLSKKRNGTLGTGIVTG